MGGCSINCHCLLLLGRLRALSSLSLVILSFLVVTLLLAFSFHWLLALIVVVVVQFLGQSLGTVEGFRICSYYIPLNW